MLASQAPLIPRGMYYSSPVSCKVVYISISKPVNKIPHTLAEAKQPGFYSLAITQYTNNKAGMLSLCQGVMQFYSTLESKAWCFVK